MIGTTSNLRVPMAAAAALLSLCARAGAENLSPSAIAASPDGQTLFVLASAPAKVLAVGLASGSVARAFPVPADPTGLAITRDGRRLLVTAGCPAGTLSIYDTRGKPEATIPAGHSPCAPQLSPDGRTAFACDRFADEVLAVDLETRVVSAHIPTGREPVASALTPDGRTLVVANLLPAGRADGDYAGTSVTLVDAAARVPAATVALPGGSTGARGVCVSPDGKFAYVTHTLARYQMPTTQLERGWMNTNAASIIDLAGRKLVATVLLDLPERGAANPWGIACSPDGRHLCVAVAGGNEIAVIDRTKLHAKIGAAADPGLLPQDDLTFLLGIQRRVPVPGRGPRAVAVVGRTVFAAEYFTDSLASLAINDPAANPRQLPLGPAVDPATLAPERRGEELFYSATTCFQGWQSCATCHPDGRVDGLNWDLLNDDLGNPKQTKSLVYAHRTPPAMMSGVRGSAEDAVRAGLRHIQFAEVPEADAAAIDAFLQSLRPVPSPALESGEFSAAARRGQEVFAKAGCATCHAGPYHSDGRAHDVGTGKGLDEGKEYDTPHLIELWRTAPYLVDGRAAEVADIFAAGDPNHPHGNTAGLTPQELADLAAYLRSL